MSKNRKDISAVVSIGDHIEYANSSDAVDAVLMILEKNGEKMT